MKLEDQKLYIKNWLEDISSRFDDSSFNYGYNTTSNTHIISVNPSNLYDTQEFDSACEWLYDNFESKYNLNILFLPSNDISLEILMSNIEMQIDSKANLYQVSEIEYVHKPLISYSIIYKNKEDITRTSIDKINQSQFQEAFIVENENKENYALAA